jgi:hypothetical protein
MFVFAKISKSKAKAKKRERGRVCLSEREGLFA